MPEEGTLVIRLGYRGADFSGFADLGAEETFLLPPDTWDRSGFVGNAAVSTGFAGGFGACTAEVLAGDTSVGFAWGSIDLSDPVACSLV